MSSDVWHLRAVRLPDGDRLEDLWFNSKGWSDRPTATAQDLPERFVLPGFVDAHSHVSFGMAANGPTRLDLKRAEANLDRFGQAGVAVLRDAGGTPAVVLGLRSSDGRPRVVAAGRHLAPAGMYFEEVHDPVEPADLVGVALREVAAGARWVKVVADFPPASARASSPAAEPEQTYDLPVLRGLVKAVHEAGARVAAHVTTPLVTDLVRMGFDSIEHGTEVGAATVAEMHHQQGTAWVPTLCAALDLPDSATPERRRRVGERRERFQEALPLAVRLGVPVLTGSDVVGSIPREVALMVECGIAPLDALRAATSTARRFLSRDLEGAPHSAVVFADDPRDDPKVLASPSAVVIGGVRVR